MPCSFSQISTNSTVTESAWKREFPAFEWIWINQKQNIFAAQEQWGLWWFQLKCSIGRMECCKRDAYDMGKDSRPTPRLPHIIFHLFTFYVFNLLSVRLSFTRVLACFRLFMNNYFEFTVLCWYTCLVNVSRDVRAVQPL